VEMMMRMMRRGGKVITIKNTTIYKCEHCRKIYQRERFAKLHPAKCRKNPCNISACSSGCKYLTSTKEDVLVSNMHGERYEELRLLRCSKQHIYIKPIWSTGEIANLCEPVETMPKKGECEYFEEETYFSESDLI